jgi:hypothetical protein
MEPQVREVTGWRAGLKYLWTAGLDWTGRQLWGLLKSLRRNLWKLGTFALLASMFIMGYMDGTAAWRLQMRHLGWGGLGEPSVWHLMVWGALLGIICWLYTSEHFSWRSVKVIGRHPDLTIQSTKIKGIFSPPLHVRNYYLARAQHWQKTLDAAMLRPINPTVKFDASWERHMRWIWADKARAGDYAVIEDGGWSFGYRKRGRGASKLLLCVPVAYLMEHGPQCVHNYAYVEEYAGPRLYEPLAEDALKGWIWRGIRKVVPEVNGASWKVYYGDEPMPDVVLSRFVDSDADEDDESLYVWRLPVNGKLCDTKSSERYATELLSKVSAEVDDLTLDLDDREKRKDVAAARKAPPPAVAAPPQQQQQQPQNNEEVRR